MRALLIRQVAIVAISFAGSVVIARLLEPDDFGVFAIVTFAVTIFTFVGDLGLRASLIQRREEITDADLQACFSIQAVITGAIIATVWVTAPLILSSYPELGPNAVLLTRLLTLNLAFAAFRSVSTIRFEREMRFSPVARIEVVETVLYQIAIILCAVAGLGIWSFVIGAILRGAAGGILVYYVAPWPLRLRFDRGLLALARRGVMFQVYAPLNALGEWATPIVVGLLVGPAGVGYVGFAQGNARRPLMVVEAVMRVSFPHFARLQDDPDLLREKIVVYLLWFQWVVAFWGVSMALIGSNLIEAIYTAKWLPAVPVLVVLACCLPLDVISWLVGYALTAVNRPLVPVAIVAIRSVAMLAISAVLVPRIGFIGIGWAYLASNLLASILLLAKFGNGLLGQAVVTGLRVVVCAVGAFGLGWALFGSWLQNGGSSLGHVAVAWPILGLLYLAISVVVLPRSQRETAIFAIRQNLSWARRRLGRGANEAVEDIP